MAESGRSKARWALGFGAALAVAVLLGWMRGPQSPPAGAGDLRAERAVPAPVRREIPPPPEVPAAPEPVPDRVRWISIRVDASAPEDWWPVPPASMTHMPWLYWPRLDEADWPDLPTAAAMDDVVQCLIDNCDGLERLIEDYVATAEDDGLLPLDPAGSGDPWTDLMAAQAAYGALFVRELERAETEEILLARHALATRVIDEAGDPTAANLARLVVSSASPYVVEGWVDVPDDGWGAELLRVAETSRDPAMVAEAVAWLTLHEDAPAVLERAEAVLPESGLLATMAQLGAMAAAVRAGRWDDALRWADRAEANPDADDDLLHQAAWVRAVAFANGHGEPTDWRVELIARARACNGAAPLSPGDSDVLFFAVTGGAWRMVSSPDESQLARCMATFAPSAPGPEDGARIQLTLVHPV